MKASTKTKQLPEEVIADKIMFTLCPHPTDHGWHAAPMQYKCRECVVLALRSISQSPAIKELVEAVERLSSAEGFEAVGVIPDDMWGDELRRRMAFARQALQPFKSTGGG